MSFKRCGSCGQAKLLVEFHKDKSTADGLQSLCQSCKRAAHRRYRQTAKGRATQQRSHSRRRSRYPEKMRARDCVANAMRDGRLERPRLCERCGKRRKTQAHHPDYSKPLEVMWLCVPCHSVVHKRNRYNQKPSTGDDDGAI